MQKIFKFIEHIGKWRVLVKTDDIQNGSITGDKIADESIDERHLSKSLKDWLSNKEGCGGFEGEGANYTPTIDERTEVNNPIGSIEIGTPLSELKGKTFSELTDMMLVKETWTDPKYTHNVSMSLKESIVLVGSALSAPIITAVWNNNVTPTINNNIQTSWIVSPETRNSIAETAGEYRYALSYSYSEGYYIIKSNLGQEKRIIVPAVKNGSIVKTLQATYNWYIDRQAQSPLVPINTAYTVTKVLTGQPVIKIPGKNSEINVQADLGFGYMDVEWNKSVERDLGSNIDYIVYSKPDSYSSSVNHKITFTIKL